MDGILCENKDKVNYQNQPDLPDAETFIPPGTYLVYLDVWRRHITALDDADIREKALGGPDTTTRIKTIWQVKLLKVADNFTCGTKPSEWVPPTGMLKACAPGAGYQGLENHLYRVEIHDTGALGRATFKWSRDNGSVVTSLAVKSNTSGSVSQIVVENLGPDEARGFANGQWVEIVDELTELNRRGQPNKLVQIVGTPDPATCTITLSETVNINLTTRPKLRRWDGHGTTANSWIPLEHGIEVQFSDATYNTGDYWLIPTRPGSTLPGGIEWPIDKDSKQPSAQPPRAIQNRDDHHYAPLALLELQSDQKFKFKENCRTFFHPLAATDLDAMQTRLNKMATDLDEMQTRLNKMATDLTTTQSSLDRSRLSPRRHYPQLGGSR